jgi:pimeloyl-ACP methyl ester carboxylesterase
LPDGAAIQYGALLEAELGVSAIYLRYNSGRSVDHNAQKLAQLRESAAKVALQVRDWVLIGHSMGGLVGRRAHALALGDAMAWASNTSMIVCLGSPTQRTALEKTGHAASNAMKRLNVTRPLVRLTDARSQGIKNLGRGLRGSPQAVGAQTPPLRLVFATLGGESTGAMGRFIDTILGDGLVMRASAADSDAAGDVQRAEITGLGHMGLLNDPRVYAALRGWLGAPGLTSSVRRARRLT